MKEQAVQKKIIKYLESKGAYVVKIISASKAGVPDLIACYQGKFIGIEVKRPETKTNVSKLQAHHLKTIAEAKGIGIVAWDIESLKEGLNEQ